MKTAALALGAGTVACAAVVLALGHTPSRPSRSDCIAGVELLWTAEDTDRIGVLNQLGDAFVYTKSYPVAAQSIRDRQRIYIIFSKDCATKEQMMEEILAVYRENVPGFPPHRTIKEPIEPSTKTIEAYGEEWSDGEFPRE